MHLFLAAFLLFQANPLVLENDFLQVFKNSAPCASAGPSCGEQMRYCCVGTLVELGRL